METDPPTPDNPLTDQLAETAITLGTGLPPAIQRSFWKAVGRVFTAGAEWPAKYLESKGRLSSARAALEVVRLEAEAADLRSQQKARDLINRKSAQAAASRFSNDDLAERALEYHAAHILREQHRREAILLSATEELSSNPPSQDSERPIEEDVLEAILREGVQRSSEDFKLLFARLLAGEIKRPGSFSISTIQSLGRMTQETAELFQVACNLSTSILSNEKPLTSRLLMLDFGSIGTNSFQRFGLSYSGFSRLVEEGLMRAELSEYNRLPPSYYQVPVVLFEHAGDRYWLSLTDEAMSANFSDSIQWTGPSFTKSGLELRQIVAMNPHSDYISGLATFHRKFGLKLFRVVAQNGNSLNGVEIRGGTAEAST